MCGFAAAEGPLPPLGVCPGALGHTGGLFLVARLDSSSLNTERPQDCFLMVNGFMFVLFIGRRLNYTEQCYIRV